MSLKNTHGVDYRYLTDLGKSQLDTPDLTLAAKSIFTAKLELLVKTLLFKRALGSSVGGRVCREIKHDLDAFHSKLFFVDKSMTIHPHPHSLLWQANA